jgi:hypothetical protein
MHANPSYRDKTMEGAKVTGELITAAASSALSKRTEGGETTGGVVGGEAARQGRGRFKSAEDSNEQLLDIEKAQETARKFGGKVIESIEKSVRRLVNDLNLIKTLDDALDEFGDSITEPEGDTKDETKKQDK